MPPRTLNLPSLTQSLQGRDLGHLRIIADTWGITFDAPDARVGLARLVSMMLESGRLSETLAALSDPARLALSDLLNHEGVDTWPAFTRRHGRFREMGPAKRDREKPHISQPSPVEALWYRGLIGRTFFERPDGLQECAYIPEEFLGQIPTDQGGRAEPLGRLATQAERQVPYPTGDGILDLACTLLAALRSGIPLTQLDRSWDDLNTPGLSPALAPSPQVLLRLLETASLLDTAGMPQPEAVRAFLEAERGQALTSLVQAWLTSPTFNELRLLPGLHAEGEWVNDPRLARQAVLDFLATIPGWLMEGDQAYRPWWSIGSFIQSIKTNDPDFQRPEGNYDTWYLKDEVTQEFLRGFENWERVDGASIRYILCGPLHWLGILDLAAPEAGGTPTAFRFSPLAAQLLQGNPPTGLPPETESIKVTSDALLRIPSLAPRAARYQLSRFCQWEGQKAGAFLFRLTPESLDRARKAGLRLDQLHALLRRHATAVPPQLQRALARWEEKGTEARLDQFIVLRLATPDLLEALRASRAARFLGDPLGPTSVIVQARALARIQSVLAEMGVLVDVRVDAKKMPE